MLVPKTELQVSNPGLLDGEWYNQRQARTTLPRPLRYELNTELQKGEGHILQRLTRFP